MTKYKPLTISVTPGEYHSLRYLAYSSQSSISAIVSKAVNDLFASPDLGRFLEEAPKRRKID